MVTNCYRHAFVKGDDMKKNDIVFVRKDGPISIKDQKALDWLVSLSCLADGDGSHSGQCKECKD